MNSLRSNSISYFVAWLKPRLNDDSENPTVSKDLFVRNVFLDLSKKHEARCAVTSLLAWLVQECFLRLIEEAGSAGRVHGGVYCWMRCGSPVSPSLIPQDTRCILSTTLGAGRRY